MQRSKRKLAAKNQSVTLRHLTSEQTNRASADLDLKSPLEIARIINKEDAKVATAVKRALPEIAQAITVIANMMQSGGRLIYVGTGTSGRIAALDAVECGPTFNVDPERVQFVIAGGLRALGAAVESNEDSSEMGERAMAERKPGKIDVVVGIAASGRTPFTIAAVSYARRRGAKTIAVTCNRNSALGRTAQIDIVAEVGPEVISGSTRMKAGTAQKMVLNMLSSGAMTRLGYVYGNLMVNVRLNNEKLAERGITILARATGADRERATAALQAANNHVPTALLMLETGCTRTAAEGALKKAAGNVRKAIAKLRARSQ
ncbi:MAG: N-acetylmuramic acid 6-phosphate etherase [Acidobacteriota bacterium]|nr:N-acetylmuramic acid 6-phosphate etherase [Acidobacteriota bacterium]